MKRNLCVVAAMLLWSAGVRAASSADEANSILYLDVNPSFGDDLTETRRNNKYFIMCEDSNLSNSWRKFKVDLNGNAWSSSLVVYGSGGIGVTNQSLFEIKESDETETSKGFILNSSGYGGQKPMGIKSSMLYVYSPMNVKGKISCEEELKVVDLDAKNIKTQDITVKMNDVADYVFEEDYDLKPLSEVETYVKENKHLPGIPAAAEMERNGMSVSAMSNMLLEKVEELTLHMIRLEKENAELKAKVEELSK